MATTHYIIFCILNKFKVVIYCIEHFITSIRRKLIIILHDLVVFKIIKNNVRIKII